MGTIDLGTLLAIMGGTFGATTAVIALLVRMLLRSYNEKMMQVYETLRKEVVDVAQDRKDCEVREGKALDRFEGIVSKLQEQWLDFQKSAATLEATRGRRLDAMFNVLDHQKEEMRTLRPDVLRKQEELHKQSMETLKLYVKKLILEQLESRTKS